ncbi:hypothetical protein BASA62_009779 [Batrachochytrium salamandrivorans]|nr:hypothetical protein BASA62_009779 [Batrachochytrium salamandrivorans]
MDGLMARPLRATTPSPQTTRGKTTPSTSNGVFDTQFNSTANPRTTINVAAAAVNLFYLVNLMHDISYQYGFTEQAGNFQTRQLWQGRERSIPNRSGGLDNGIAIHEYVHGISLRLTGGPTASGCLDTKEARGLSEGWSDAIAMIVLARSSDTATTSIPMGAMGISPLGVYWSLVTKYGFSTNLYDAKQSEGNIVTMQIIIGGMMLQPCNPTFLSARDAIISADKLHYNGAHKCEIYKGFGNRGLGLGATRIRIDDFSIPPECERR